MTVFTKTIENSVNMFGPQETNKWGALVWGVDNWAYSSFDLPVIFKKIISETMSLDSAITTFLIYIRQATNSLAITGDMYEETLKDLNGYYKVFDGGRNAETRPLTGYNSLSDITTSYTQTVAPGTSYTQIN